MARLTESAEVREEIVRALGLDPDRAVGRASARGRALAGLGAGRPTGTSQGFWFPGMRRRRSVATPMWTRSPRSRRRQGSATTRPEDRRAAKKGFFPSSMGLSFLVGADVDTLGGHLSRWGDYHRVEAEGSSSGGDGGAEAGKTPGGRRPAGRGARGRTPRRAAEMVVRTASPPPTRPEGGASSVRSWWQRTPHEVTVPVPLPAVAGIPALPTGPELRRPHPSRGRPPGGMPRILRGGFRPEPAPSPCSW